ncbi:hypothetical protein WJ972_15615 [Achromobacter insuavis]
MNLWKAIATLLIICLAVASGMAGLATQIGPEQRQMLICVVTPNCVYVIGVEKK